MCFEVSSCRSPIDELVPKSRALGSPIRLTARATPSRRRQRSVICWGCRERHREQTDDNLKQRRLPARAFDLILAMDVFEHLYDPVDVVRQLSESLKPGGFLFSRFGVEDDEDQPQHIVHDFADTLDAVKQVGFAPVWQDEWLWGHQAFQKS